MNPVQIIVFGFGQQRFPSPKQKAFIGLNVDLNLLKHPRRENRRTLGGPEP